MHNLVADPTDTFAAARSSAITEGFPHHVALGKMASLLKYVYTLQRIAPILNVGCYFVAFYPTSGTLVALVWRCATFWNILKSSSRKMLLPVTYRYVSWPTRTMLCLSACVYVCCLCAFCITWSLIWWTIVRTYVSALQASPYAVYVHTFAYECSHSIRSSTACWANVLRTSMLESLVSSKWHIPHRV